MLPPNFQREDQPAGTPISQMVYLLFGLSSIPPKFRMPFVTPKVEPLATTVLPKPSGPLYSLKVHVCVLSTTPPVSLSNSILVFTCLLRQAPCPSQASLPPWLPSYDVQGLLS